MVSSTRKGSASDIFSLLGKTPGTVPEFFLSGSVGATRRARGNLNVVPLNYGMNSVAYHVRLVRQVLSDTACSC
jgi:hypothetical protein